MLLDWECIGDYEDREWCIPDLVGVIFTNIVEDNKNKRYIFTDDKGDQYKYEAYEHLLTDYVNDSGVGSWEGYRSIGTPIKGIIGVPITKVYIMHYVEYYKGGYTHVIFKAGKQSLEFKYNLDFEDSDTRFSKFNLEEEEIEKAKICRKKSDKFGDIEWCNTRKMKFLAKEKKHLENAKLAREKGKVI